MFPPPGIWLLVTGYWQLASCIWLLAAGHLSPAFSCQLLIYSSLQFPACLLFLASNHCQIDIKAKLSIG